jgi:hypothetical protein
MTHGRRWNPIHTGGESRREKAGIAETQNGHGGMWKPGGGEREAAAGIKPKPRSRPAKHVPKLESFSAMMVGIPTSSTASSLRQQDHSIWTINVVLASSSGSNRFSPSEGLTALPRQPDPPSPPGSPTPALPLRYPSRRFVKRR